MSLHPRLRRGRLPAALATLLLGLVPIASLPARAATVLATASAVPAATSALGPDLADQGPAVASESSGAGSWLGRLGAAVLDAVRDAEVWAPLAAAGALTATG